MICVDIITILEQNLNLDLDLLDHIRPKSRQNLDLTIIIKITFSAIKHIKIGTINLLYMKYITKF